MSTLMDPPELRDASGDDSPAQRLRHDMAAMRLSFTWLGTRKTLTSAQKARAAESFGAQGNYLSAGKKLIDTRHPAFKAVTKVRHRAVSYWKGMSLPYPDPGVRLIRRADIHDVDRRMRRFEVDLLDAVEGLDRQFAQLKAAAQQRLGSLFNPADYPDSLMGAFDIAWDYPSFEPPSYLRDLSPQLYQHECQRVAARFNEAVELAEAAFAEELGKLVDHLHERLAGRDDGKPKVFRDSAVENLTSFFERFSKLNVRSNAQLDELVERAKRVVTGVAPQELRDDGGLRRRVAQRLDDVRSSLDDLLIDRPRRNIIRPRGNSDPK